MKAALVVGSGPTVRDEFAAAWAHEPGAFVIGVNWGGIVALPDVLFGNHADLLAEKIGPAVAAHWGLDRLDLHTTPLPLQRDYARRHGMTTWPAAYVAHCGSGLCAALAARLMSFERIVMVGCPHRGPYDPGRAAFDPAGAAAVDWGAGRREAGRRNMDAGLRTIAPMLRGAVTSTSGMTAEVLGMPEWMTGDEPWLAANERMPCEA